MVISANFNKQQDVESLSLVSGVAATDLQTYLTEEEIRRFDGRSCDPVRHGLNLRPTGFTVVHGLAAAAHAAEGNNIVALAWGA